MASDQQYQKIIAHPFACSFSYNCNKLKTSSGKAATVELLNSHLALKQKSPACAGLFLINISREVIQLTSIVS